MLLRTLGASLLGNLLICKDTIRVSEGTIRADKGTVKAGQHFSCLLILQLTLK